MKDIVYWLKGFRGIGPYFSYHPPCNFSRDNDLPNIDEDDNVCTIGPGAQRGLEYVWPDVKFKNNADLVTSVDMAVEQQLRNKLLQLIPRT